MIITKQEVAAELGISISSLESQEKRFGPIPSTIDNRRRVMRVRDVIQWEVSRRLSETIGDDGDMYDHKREKGRLTFHQANKTAIESEKLAGSLVDAEEVQERFLELVLGFKKNLLNMPNRVAHDILMAADEISVKELLISEIKEALNELSEN